jgi:hypothetical protein
MALAVRLDYSWVSAAAALAAPMAVVAGAAAPDLREQS